MGEKENFFVENNEKTQTYFRLNGMCDEKMLSI